MTTLVSWISYSTTGEKPELPRAVYIASDSRITWGSDALRWDSGKKVFSTRDEPHIFGYCGDVIFPSLVLGQIVTAIDKNVLFKSGLNPDQKHDRILGSIKSSYANGHNHPVKSFSIIHVHRVNDWPNTEFVFWQVTYDAKTGHWESNKLSLPKETGLIVALGSGAQSANAYQKLWENSDSGGLSRSFFSAFCDAIDSGRDKLSGGSPQLCALYSRLQPQDIGVIHKERYFLHGLEIDPTSTISSIEWKDRLFQDIDPKTKEPKAGARRFARPANSNT